ASEEVARMRQRGGVVTHPRCAVQGEKDTPPADREAPQVDLLVPARQQQGPDRRRDAGGESEHAPEPIAKNANAGPRRGDPALTPCRANRATASDRTAWWWCPAAGCSRRSRSAPWSSCCPRSPCCRWSRRSSCASPSCPPCP